MANTIPFEKLVKYQMKRFKECNHKFKSPKTNEDENTKSHNYALVSEIQCLVSNLLQFVKIIKHATSIADGSLCKRERKAEDLLAGERFILTKIKTPNTPDNIVDSHNNSLTIS